MVSDTVLAALIWIHCNLRRLNLETLLKNDLQQSNQIQTRVLATNIEAS